jgi:glutaminyl-tRNA synthetase
MPTIVGLRRRGYTPAAIQLFAERIGVSKADSAGSTTRTLEGCAARRPRRPRRTRHGRARPGPAQADQLDRPLVLGDARSEPCSAPVHPHHPEQGQRSFNLTPGKELWIEREDFMEEVHPRATPALPRQPQCA